MEPIEQKVQRLEAEIAALRSHAAVGAGLPESGLETNTGLWREVSDLRLSEERFRRLVESVPDYAIFMLDPSGHVVSWNIGAVHIKGYAADEIIGRHFSCFYLPEEIATGRPDNTLKIVVEKGRFAEEGRRQRKGGERYWELAFINAVYNDAGVLCGFANVARDISLRKHAEEKARLMVQLAVNAMILVNSKGRLMLVNLQTEKLFGYSQEELIGQPVELLVPESSRANHPSQREKFFANPSIREMGAGRDLFGRRKDGSEFPVEIGLNPIHTDEELIVLGSIVDITERKRAEEKSRRHLTELAHAGRLSSIGEMFSELAHEINQPLAAASNYARACLRTAESKTGVSQEQLLDWIKKSASQTERASEIVKRIGMFVKKERAVRTEVNINELVDNVIALPTLLNSSSEGRMKTVVILELDESLPTIFAEKVQIEQVLLNLVRNAIEAMEEIEPGQRQLRVKTEQLNGRVQVSVVDNGTGISAELQTKLFNPFFTTKTEGLGLGLSISRSIIEGHSGQMFINSSPGCGTTVAFQLPIGTGDAIL